MAKVLLVEDDNNLREIYEARLTAEGYDIITAQNGEEALSAAKQSKPDLVISDVMMPRISGFEMLDILRNTDELKNTKVIMLTALGQAEDRNRADNLGADKYLVKSQVTLEDIVNAAKELLSEEPGEVVMPSVVTAAPVATPDPVAVSPAPSTDVSSTQQVVAPVSQPVEVPEPVASKPVSPAPTEPTAAPVVAPVAAPISMPEPVMSTPVATEPTAAMAVEPVAQVAVPVATEPSSSIVSPTMSYANTTVTVTDPDPITQHVSPPAEPLEPEETPDVVPVIVPETAPVTAPEQGTEPTASSTVPEIMPSAEPQSLADEEAAIQAQIDSFAASDQPAAPTQAQSGNDAILDDAINKLTGVASPSAAPSEQPAPDQSAAAEPVAEPATEQVEDSSAAAVPPADTTSQITGRKVIQPLSDAEAGTTNLDVLLAQEEAKEAAQNQATPQPTVSTTPATPPTPGFDPNSIAL